MTKESLVQAYVQILSWTPKLLDTILAQVQLEPCHQGCPKKYTLSRLKSCLSLANGLCSSHGVAIPQNDAVYGIFGPQLHATCRHSSSAGSKELMSGIPRYWSSQQQLSAFCRKTCSGQARSLRFQRKPIGFGSS